MVRSRYNPRMARAPESLVGSIERVTFHNPDNGFAVLNTTVKGQRDLVTFVGHLTFATPGEFVEASGRWAVDRGLGQQFKANSIRTTHPGSPEGMEQYLGSGFVTGIGPHFAAKLVESFGEEVFEIIEEEPERLEPRSTSTCIFCPGWSYTPSLLRRSGMVSV